MKLPENACSRETAPSPIRCKRRKVNLEKDHDRFFDAFWSLVTVTSEHGEDFWKVFFFQLHAASL